MVLDVRNKLKRRKKMKRLLKYTAILLMVLMASSSVWAFSYTDHVTTAPNNKGDALIFPWYLALDGGWQTKLTVINTNLTNAVVAKVVIRSMKNSEELIDFFIYLSPSDVWTGVLKRVAGSTFITSNDDSVVYSTSPLVFANTTPINQPMFGMDCKDDADFIGYAEVIMAAYKPGQSIGTTKDKIFRGFRDTTVGNEGGAAVTTAGSESIGTMYFPYSLIAIRDLVDNPNSLAGYMELQNATLGLSTSLRATALKDYDTNTKLTTGDETRLGELSRNTLMEVEDALSKNNVAMPYVNGNNTALHFMTFPTKLTQRPFTDCTFLSPKSPFFNQNASDISVLKTAQYCIQYGVRPFDLTEKTPSSGPFSGGGSINNFCNEVNFLASSLFPYAEGWANYFIAAPGDGTTAPFTVGQAKDATYLDDHGAPVIPTYLYLGSLGIAANYGAWTDTHVHSGTFTGTTFTPTGTLIDYQYTDSAISSVVF
jgi:hypothetical protein